MNDTGPLYDYCGSSLWDENLTWYTENPDFTECFQETVLVWTPCAFLWVFSILEIYFIRSSKGRFIPWTALNILKTIVNLILIVLCIADLVWAVDSQNGGTNDIHPADIFTPVIKLATLVLALVLLLAGKRRGIRSSGTIFMFWLLLAVTGAITYRSLIMRATSPIGMLEQFTFITYMVYYPMVLLMLLLNCFSDAPPQYEASEYKTENPSPELAASFISRMTFSWFDKLAILGYRRSLETKDLWQLKPEDRSHAIIPRWDRHWAKALAKSHQKSTVENDVAFSKGKGSVDVNTTLKKNQVSIFPTMVKTFGMQFLFGSALKLFQDLMTFVSPLLLSALIDFTESDDYAWRGYMYAGLLTASALIQTIFLSQYFQHMYVVGMGIRTAIVSAVYKKALRISNSARKESTVGEIVNLMSVDAQRFMDLTSYLNMLWSAPMQIGLAIYFLYNILGASVFAGLAVMILLIPINGVLANKTKKLQVAQMKNKDKRVKLMNEILSGIKVLKLYAWEPSFQDQVEEIRDREIHVLRKAAYLSAGTSFLWTCAPFLVSLVTFGVYVLSSIDNVLDAQKAFVSLTLFNIMRMPMSILPMMIIATIQVALMTFTTYVLVDPAHVLSPKIAFSSLALFNILRFPMSMLPMIITQAVQAAVSLKRMNKFMNADELEPDAVSHEPDEKSPIVVQSGAFAWGKDEEPVLKNINLEIEEGSLVAIVGQVGAGKSSLISALLGEMDKLSGRVNTKGTIAYVPQQAWIQNTTLKNNIIFGGSEEPGHYNEVIDACALRPDLEMLPAGDATEIGEKGINLSGGQKQRVSLSRAVYCNRDVYFLDDPLSAVDTHVGKHIFDHVIGPKGLLKDKTRLLVTHGITFLPQTDKIIVLKNGAVSEVGSYKELLAKKGDFADFLVEHLTEQEQEDDVTELSKIREELESSLGREQVQRQISRQRSHNSESHSESGSTSPLRSPQKELSQELVRSGSIKANGEKSKSPAKDGKALVSAPEVKKGEKLIEAEKAETGKVKPEVYMHYLRSVGYSLTFWTLLLYAIYQLFSVGSNVWLSAWSNAYVNTNHTNGTTEAVPIPESERDMFLGVYGALGFGQAISIGVASLVNALGTLYASRYLHTVMLRHLFKSPMSFFDTTPLGRIVNRFAKDVDTVDNVIPNVLKSWLQTLLSV